MNLEKNGFVQSQIRKLIIDEKELTEQYKINNNIFTFYQNGLINHIDKINLPILSNGQKKICDATVTQKETYDAFQSMENDKKPGNDGLSKQFYKVFWDGVKIPLLASINNAFIKEELITSQKQLVIKLIDKKTPEKFLLSAGDQYPW